MDFRGKKVEILGNTNPKIIDSYLLNHWISSLDSDINLISLKELNSKEINGDFEFIKLYNDMMETVVNPMIKESREHRAKFRSILSYYRTLKE